MIQVTLDGLVFSTAPDAVYSLADLDGWYSGAPPRSEVNSRPNADGAFGVVRVFRAPRVLTMTGLILAESVAAPQWDAFAGLMADGKPKQIEVVDDAGARYAEVTLHGTPHVGLLVDGEARYSVQLIARDPVKYGPPVGASSGLPTAGGGLEYPMFSGGAGGALFYGALGNLGRVTLVNEGRADTWPVFTVSGFLADGFELRCIDLGLVWRYDRVVPAGTTVTIDSATGSVLIDGVSDGSAYLTRDEAFPVPAQGSCEVQFSAITTGSGASVSVTSWSGWW